MAESQTTSAQPNGMPRGQSRQGRRGRPSRNRGGRSRGGPQAGGRSRATDAVVPEPAAADAAPGNVSANASTNAGESARGGRGSRGRRGARQPRGNRDRGPRTAFGTQRTFGGRLTEAPTDESGETASLNADAPAFVPGQPVSVGT